LRAIIFANGELNYHKDSLKIDPGDLLVAADGGARHCQALGLVPQVLIGDFDSLEPGELSAFETQGVEVIQHPARKDYTDLELALQFAVEKGYREILVLGALGNRWDQTFANLLISASKAFAEVNIRLVDGPHEILLMRSGQVVELDGEPGDTVSLIPLCGDVHGIVTSGLEYPLKRETLFFGETRGISNVLTGQTASVKLDEGMLLTVIIHQPKGE